MFTFYKKHNNKLYNKLAQFSRNKFFYENIKLSDDFETRALLIFFHLAIILKISKGKAQKSKSQEIFDNIFQNIEYNMREIGHGDVSVNKNMKNLNKIFYDILYKIDKDKGQTDISKSLLKKYFFNKNDLEDQKVHNLANYLNKFEDFCFDLDVDIMLNGTIDFKYR